jgi:hypothetical protein
MKTVLLALALLLPALVRADGIPTSDPLAYSGVLLNSVGTPVTSTVTARLSLWDDQTATLTANRKCETSVPTLTPDSAGRFRILLEAACLAAVKTNPNLWVQVEIGTVALPRTKLGAVPYAVEADRAAVATNATSAAAAATVTNSVRTGLVQFGTANCAPNPSAGPNVTDCRCNADEIAIGGGAAVANGTDAVTQSRNAFNAYGDNRAWRTSCSSSTGAPVLCGASHAICLKVSP